LLFVAAFLSRAAVLSGLDRFYSISSVVSIAFAGDAREWSRGSAPRRAEGIALWTSAATVVLAGDPFVALHFYGLE
jgi:hypothetical protein